MYFGIYFFFAIIIEFTHGMLVRRDLSHAVKEKRKKKKEKKNKMVLEKKNKARAYISFLPGFSSNFLCFL